MEMWKDIQGYEEKYQISNIGRIKNKINNRLLRPRVGTYGYYKVNLYKNKKVKTIEIHRLVAEAFIENPESKSEVNHIDGNKLNNNITNLEWVTHKENINHAWRTKLFEPVRKASKRYGKSNPNAKKVYQIKNNIIIGVFDTIKEAATKTNTNKTNIGKCCHNKRKTANGFEWRFSPPYR